MDLSRPSAEPAMAVEHFFPRRAWEGHQCSFVRHGAADHSCVSIDNDPMTSFLRRGADAQQNCGRNPGCDSGCWSGAAAWVPHWAAANVSSRLLEFHAGSGQPYTGALILLRFLPQAPARLRAVTLKNHVAPATYRGLPSALLSCRPLRRRSGGEIALSGVPSAR
jgi:hypothetical protein